MKYTHTDYDFSVDTLPIGVGEFSRMLRNNKAYIGQLYEEIIPTLFNTPGVRAGKFWFTLVNVSCPHTGFSYGLSPTPPKAACPMTGTWLYTFALKDYWYGEDSEVTHSFLHGNSIMWGKKGNEFLTIGTTHSEAGKFNLQYNSFAPQWLYHLIGPITKNFLLRSRFYTEEDDYSEYYVDKKQSVLYAQYHMMPLCSVVRNVPYHLWIFNRHAWVSGSLLLSQRHITAESLLYYCRYIRSVGDLAPDVAAIVVDKFHESLTDLIQRRDSGESPSEDWQLLYAALVNRGKIPDGLVSDFLVSQEPDIVIPSGDFKSHILALFYA